MIALSYDRQVTNGEWTEYANNLCISSKFFVYPIVKFTGVLDLHSGYRLT